MTISKKEKMMKIFGLLDKFLIEFNISLSIGIGSHIDGEFLLPKSCFEVGLRLSLPPLFKNVVCHLHLAPNQLCINIERLIIFMVVLDHMKGLGISAKNVLYIYNVIKSPIPHEWYLLSSMVRYEWNYLCALNKCRFR